jgi:hypothetical protein
MKISVYTSAFNLLKNGFLHWEQSLKLSSEFADEVVVAVNTSQDDTENLILELGLKNLKIVCCDISYDDPLLDGKIKDIALKKCSGDILVQLDIDEFIPKNQHTIWRKYAEILFSQQNFDCYMIPSLNIYKDWHMYKDITPKWYMHKKGFHRGPVEFARNPDGTVDTNRSDTCELIDDYGRLVKYVILPHELQDLKYGSIFVVHFGYLNLESRLKRNHEFWHRQWFLESGGKTPPHKIHMNQEDFNEPHFIHDIAFL